MTEKNKNLLIRIVTAVLMLPAVLYLLYLGGWYTACCEGFQRQVLRQQQIAPACGDRVVIWHRKFDQDMAPRGIGTKLWLFATGR